MHAAIRRLHSYASLRSLAAVQLSVFPGNGVSIMKRIKIVLRALLFYLLVSITSFGPTTPAMAASAASEQTLIAAFLFNFLKFTEWPENSLGAELTLCTSKHPAFEELNAIGGRPAQGKPVKIKRLQLGDSTQDCQLLYLPQEEGAERIRDWLKTVNTKPVLVVSNINGFLDMGGMLVLNNDGKNLHFSVNLDMVRQSSLKLSAQLLQIAREVRGR